MHKFFIPSMGFIKMVVISLCSCYSTYAQEVLTLEQAVEIAIANNYNIKIASNQTAIAQANNTLGNAGFLPQIGINASQIYNRNNTQQEFFSGDIRQGNNVKSNNLNANIQLNWTVFDGLAMFVNRERLTEITKSNEINTKLNIENNVAQVTALYFNINQTEKAIQTLTNSLNVSRERRELANLRKNIGTGSQIEVLQSEVDINSDSSQIVLQQQTLQSQKIRLNDLLGRNPSINFITVDQQLSDWNLEMDEVINSAMARNKALALSSQNIEIAKLDVERLEANRYPTISLNTGYSYAKSETEIGLLKFNKNSGFSFGVTGTYNLFNGFNNNREIQIAKLNVQNAQHLNEQTTNSLLTEIYVKYNDMMSFKKLSDLEAQNVEIAQQNLNLILERMRVGTIQGIEIRIAQINLLETQFRKITADFQAIISEIELRRLSGNIVSF